MKAVSKSSPMHLKIDAEDVVIVQEPTLYGTPIMYPLN